MISADKGGTNDSGKREIVELFNGIAVFETPKPTDLVKHLITMSSDDAIVVDFFSGSATTAQAVMQKNSEDGGSRQFILVQSPEQIAEDKEAYKAGYRTIDEIGQERIKRAAAKIREENPLFAGDLGFKHYTLRDVPENVLDKIIEFDPNTSGFANNLLEMFGRETVLETWKVRDGYGMNVDEQKGVVTVAQKYDYDKDGQVVAFPSGTFDELLSRFRLFVIQNKRYPFMDGERNEIALRKWYREVGHGLVTITVEQKVLFDNLSVEFADMPKNRSQLVKLSEKDAPLESDALFVREDIQTIEDMEEEDIDPNNDRELPEFLNTSQEGKDLPQTIQATLDLAEEGYTFEAIVTKRELSAFTISKHLSYLILHGMVDVSDYVDHYTYTLISNVIQDLPEGATSKRIKRKCPEGIKRNTIRMVMADLKRKQKAKNKAFG